MKILFYKLNLENFKYIIKWTYKTKQPINGIIITVNFLFFENDEFIFLIFKYELYNEKFKSYN